MTTLTVTHLPIPTAKMNGESNLPHLFDINRPGEPADFNLDEDDGLFLNYAGIRTSFPYRAQDNYTRELTDDGLDAVILENDHLRATFMPGCGGKLWSLFDKDDNRELLFANHVFRPAYLALRNAWTSGGVEWNCGALTGHHPYTCSALHTATLTAEESGLGCPVLRFWSYERIRSVVHQMDFYLPEGSHFLHARMRVVNDQRTATDMYWWSNIAVPSDEEARVVVPADFAFTTVEGKVTKVAVPMHNDIDISYPMNNPIAVDYFFKTFEDRRHYTSHIGKDGKGFVQTSTRRQKGRKLFVWGRGQGGNQWQEFLSGDDGRGHYQDGKYCEIQCGLADSQYECIPMPPKTAWEWMEYYGPIAADPEKIHGDWKDAQNELERVLETCLPLEVMEQELKDTRAMAKTEIRAIIRGDGFGALENERRKAAGLPPMCPHLDFGATGDDQAMWMLLLKEGSLQNVEKEIAEGRKAPCSYQRGWDWIKLLEKAVSDADRYFWLTHYLLGCAYMAQGQFDKAETALTASLKGKMTAWNLYAIGELARINGDEKKAAEIMVRAAGLTEENWNLCKRTAQLLCAAGLWQEEKEFIEGLPAEVQELPRIRLYRAMAALKNGDIELCDTLMNEKGGLEVPDFREGEVSLTQLWYDLEEKKAEKDGRTFDRAAAKPPKKFDFRMNAE